MVVMEELLNSRLENERAVIIEAITKIVHEQMHRNTTMRGAARGALWCWCH